MAKCVVCKQERNDIIKDGFYKGICELCWINKFHEDDGTVIDDVDFL